MQLFKSQGLQEPARPATRTYRDGGFGRRYGRGTAVSLDLSTAGNDDDGAFDSDAARAILRSMAVYDRVA